MREEFFRRGAREGLGQGGKCGGGGWGAGGGGVGVWGCSGAVSAARTRQRCAKNSSGEALARDLAREGSAAAGGRAAARLRTLAPSPRTPHPEERGEAPRPFM